MSELKHLHEQFTELSKECEFKMARVRQEQRDERIAQSELLKVKQREFAEQVDQIKIDVEHLVENQRKKFEKEVVELEKIIGSLRADVKLKDNHTVEMQREVLEL